jgi:hypothetical protein
MYPVDCRYVVAVPSRPLTMPRLALLLFASILLSVSPSTAHAQDTTQRVVRDSTQPGARDSVVEVRLRDGSVLYGRILAQDSIHFVLRTIGGTEVKVQRDLLASMRVARGRLVNGEYWAPDPNGTRLFFTSTGRALGRGEGYISTYFLIFPFVAYGVTDRFTIAGGTPIIPDAIGRAFYLAPKLTLHETPRSSFAVGALSFALTDRISDGTFGLLYGVGTWGDRDNAVTAGAGWGYQWGNGNSSASNAPVIVLGGETRVSRRVKLVTENWIYAGSGSVGGLFSGGVRFIGDRLSADLGVIGVGGADDVGCCLPIVNFVWNFGKSSR